MSLLKSIEATLLDGQYGHPQGLIGRVLGEQMVRQHVPETDWTLSLLKIQPGDQVLEHYQFLLEKNIVPGMHKLGFARAIIEQGPDSRQFKTTALIGLK